MDDKLSKMLDEVEAMYPAEEYPEIADAMDSLNSAIAAAEGESEGEEPAMEEEELDLEQPPMEDESDELDMEDEEEGLY